MITYTYQLKHKIMFQIIEIYMSQFAFSIRQCVLFSIQTLPNVFVERSLDNKD